MEEPFLQPGQIVLIEQSGVRAPSDRGPAKVTGVVVQAHGHLMVDCGTASPLPADGDDVTVSVFSSEALFRIHARVRRQDLGLVDFEQVHEVERVQRRRTARCPLHLEVSLSVGEHDAAVVAGRTLDMGSQGMRVHTRQELPNQGLSAVVIALPDGSSLRARARVVHGEPSQDGFRYGLAFDDLAEGDASRIEDLLGPIPPLSASPGIL